MTDASGVAGGRDEASDEAVEARYVKAGVDVGVVFENDVGLGDERTDDGCAKGLLDLDITSFIQYRFTGKSRPMRPNGSVLTCKPLPAGRAAAAD